MPSLNFTSLRCLQEVERRGSFTDAAAELRISQPALSHSLAELSRRLGAPLFRKAGRRRVLTEPGRRVARYADGVLGQTAELLRWLRGWEKGEVGTLRVGMIDTVGLYTLPPGLSRLRTEHAGIDLQLVVDDSGALLGMLDDYRIDLAFVVGPAGAAYRSAPVTTEGMHIYSPPGPAPRRLGPLPLGLADPTAGGPGPRPTGHPSPGGARVGQPHGASPDGGAGLCPDGASPPGRRTRGRPLRGSSGRPAADRGSLEGRRGPRPAGPPPHETGDGGLTPTAGAPRRCIRPCRPAGTPPCRWPHT